MPDHSTGIGQPWAWSVVSSREGLHVLQVVELEPR